MVPPFCYSDQKKTVSFLTNEAENAMKYLFADMGVNRNSY